MAWNFAMERTLWKADHGTLPSVESLTLCKDNAVKILRPSDELNEARASELQARMANTKRGLPGVMLKAICLHKVAEAALQRTEHKSYDRNKDIRLIVDRSRKPVLSADPLLLYDSIALPPGAAFEPEPDSSSADDDDKEVDGENDSKDKEASESKNASAGNEAGESKSASKGKEADGDKRPQTEAERITAADVKHGRKTERRVYPGGRFNYEGTPRGTLYRDVKLLRPAYTHGLADVVHGGLLYHDLRHTRAPGAFLSPPAAIHLFLFPYCAHAAWCAMGRCLRAHVLPQLDRPQRAQPSSFARLHDHLAWRDPGLGRLESIPRPSVRRPHAPRQAAQLAGGGRPADGS